jgi:hypothetical protein
MRPASSRSSVSKRSSAASGDDDRREDEVIVKKVDQVKRRIEAMLGEGLRRRQSIFF